MEVKYKRVRIAKTSKHEVGQSSLLCSNPLAYPHNALQGLGKEKQRAIGCCWKAQNDSYISLGNEHWKPIAGTATGHQTEEVGLKYCNAAPIEV